MFTINPRFFNGVAIVCAVLLVPVFSYGSAFLMDNQKQSVSASPNLVKAPIATQLELPAELRNKIAEAIALAESIQ